MNQGQSLELFFIDGKPDGMLTAEVFNWTGHVLMTPRTQLSKALQRKEAGHTGIYLLLGEDENGALAYIGEGENIRERIKNHDTNKDWWTSAVIITTASDNLHKAHAKYLEARLVNETRKIGKVRLENANIPKPASLTEAAQANMESFLDYILMVLPALRIDFLLAQTRPAKSGITTQQTEQEASPLFELMTPKHKIKASARLENGEFVVEAGSIARKSWTGKGTENSGYGKLFNELLGSNVLQADGNNTVFTENYAFKSPSAAAAVVNGRPANGTIEWKLQSTGKTYKEWEAEQLAGEPRIEDLR